MFRLDTKIKKLRKFDEQIDSGTANTDKILSQIKIDILFIKFSRRMLEIYDRNQKAYADQQLKLFDDTRRRLVGSWLSHEDAQAMRHDLNRFQEELERVKTKLQKPIETDDKIMDHTPNLFKDNKLYNT